MPPALSAIDPAITVQRDAVDLLVTETGRSDQGIVATVQAMNGEVCAARTVKLAQASDRNRFAREVTAVTDLGLADVKSALLELMAAVEVALRTAGRPAIRVRRTRWGRSPRACCVA